MRVMGVGSLNLTMHSTTDLNVKLTQVYVTERIRSTFSLSMTFRLDKPSPLTKMAHTSLISVSLSN